MHYVLTGGISNICSSEPLTVKNFLFQTFQWFVDLSLSHIQPMCITYIKNKIKLNIKTRFNCLRQHVHLNLQYRWECEVSNRPRSTDCWSFSLFPEQKVTSSNDTLPWMQCCEQPRVLPPPTPPPPPQWIEALWELGFWHKNTTQWPCWQVS